MFSGFLRKEREKRGISQERLCRGVCAVSALSRYENGERIPDRLLMNTLIERLGKSSDKLVTMISCQEYAYFEWKSKVKETLRKKNIALVQELILRKEARDASVNLVLQEQFYQYIQEIVNGKEGEISSLEEAIRLTNPDFTGRIAAEGLFSIQELELLLLYAQRQMETRAGQGAKLLEDVLSYIQEHMTDIQAKNQIFPRAVCLYCRYVTGEANAQKRYLLCREAFENSRKDQRFEYTVELLGYMRKDAICLGKEFEAVSYQVWKKILEAMYQEYGVEIPQAEWGIEIPQNLFLIPEILLSARVEQGASQEEISEGICTPETYSRIETGKRSPSLKNLEALKSRLKIRSGYYMGEVWTEDFAVLELVQELRAAVSASNLKAWEMCQQRLEEKLDLSKKINRQYTEGYRTCLEYQKGKFLEDEWIRRQIALAEKIRGEKEKAVEIWELLLKDYGRSRIRMENHFKEVMLIWSNLANTLPDVGKTKEGIALADQGIRMVLEKGQGPLNMLFANRIYAMKEAGQDVRKEQFEQAYALSEMFGDLELQNSLKYYIQKNWPSKEKIH